MAENSFDMVVIDGVRYRPEDAERLGLQKQAAKALSTAETEAPADSATETVDQDTEPAPETEAEKKARAPRNKAAAPTNK